jgi:hypothetical protein
VDYLGLASIDCSNPCSTAQQQKLVKHGESAGVVCCGGKAYACVWDIGSTTSDPTARGIITDCARAHEQNHIDNHIKACSSWWCARVSRPALKIGKDQAECEGYQSEFACLKSALSKCGDNEQCRLEIMGTMNAVDGAIKVYCRAAGITPREGHQ